ncbi:K(lysine) acetyltransferase [Thoreauomyces humboldtii]|nr:K(lysine) acetyltransferase [Thoreauomyces humboldtii]
MPTSHCKKRKTPGRVVYHKESLRIHEIDGRSDKLYCQNLCLLTKLFLDHKTVYFDMEQFLFYLLTRTDGDKDGEQILGYFSKEKHSYESYNLACILILPPHQRKGYGRMLIEFSYELSKRQEQIGSPERPLSDLGLLGYRSYWQRVMIDVVRSNPGARVTVRDVAIATGIHEEDLIDALESMDCTRVRRQLEDGVEDGGRGAVCMTEEMISSFLDRHKMPLERSLDMDCIMME